MQQNVFDHLTPDVVLNAVEQAGLLCDGRCYALNSYENRVYLVGLDDGSARVAKFYRPHRWTREQIAEEGALLFHLVDAKVPVVSPLRDPSGNWLVESSGYQVCLFPHMRGQAPNLEDLDSLYAIGELVGQLHRATADYHLHARTHDPLLDRVCADVSYLLQYWIPDALQSTFEHMGNTLCEAMATVINPQSVRLIHGDLHLGNMLVTDRVHLLDFDDTRMGYAVEDIMLLLSGSEITQQQQLSELIEGYEQFCEFPRSQLCLLHGLRAARMIHYFAWIGRRWSEPAFQHAFPWFTHDDWQVRIRDMSDQVAAMSTSSIKKVTI